MRSEGFASNHIVKLYFCLQENELKVDIGEGNTLGQMSPKLLAKVKLNFDHNSLTGFSIMLVHNSSHLNGCETIGRDTKQIRTNMDIGLLVWLQG